MNLIQKKEDLTCYYTGKNYIYDKLNIQLMKKLFFIATTMSLLSLASCTKDYNCVCTTTNSSDNSSSSTTVTITGKKKDVTTTCESGSTTYGTYTKKCEIK